MPSMLWCDNVSTLALASNPIFHARTKHIEVDYYYIREKVLSKELQVHFISTLDQLANIFTKAFSSPKFLELASKLMGVPSFSLRGDVKIDETKAESKRPVVEWFHILRNWLLYILESVISANQSRIKN